MIDEMNLGENMENEQINLDPTLEKLLDVKSYKDKLELLYELKDRLTTDMIRIICITHDIEITAETVEEQYNELRSCFQMMEKYEGSRLPRSNSFEPSSDIW